MDDETRYGGFRPEGQPQHGGPAQDGPPPSGAPPLHAGAAQHGGPPQYAGPPQYEGPPAYGAPDPGQPQYGPPQYGQPQYGQPQYGQPQYGPPQYGQPQYGPAQPGQGPYGQAQPGQTEYLAADPGARPGGQPPPPRPRSRGKMILAGVAAATAVAVTAGGVYAYTALSGGGAALASRVPADVVGYVEVNLDPPAGQKVAALRFFRHFPDLKVGGDGGSLVDSFIEPLIENPDDRRKFSENIKPWLGKHAALAADPQGDKAQPVVVVETTDPAKTREGLDRLNAGEPDASGKVGYVIDGDIVVLAAQQGIAETAVRDGKAGSLAGTDMFKSDVDGVGGDDGVLTAWADLAKAARYDTRPEGSAAVDVRGRLAASLRFTDTSADLVVRAVDSPAKVAGEAVGPRLRTLPDDTAGAIALSGGDELVRQGYDQLEKAGLDRDLQSAAENTGLELPEDIAALVGSSTVLAFGGTESQPDLGMVSKTSDPDRARRAAEKVLPELDKSGSLTVRSAGDRTVIANSAGYADRLTAEGTLGSKDEFKAALPDLDSAQAAVYVDIRRASELAGEPLDASVKALRSFGLTATSKDNISTVRMRLVVG